MSEAGIEPAEADGVPVGHWLASSDPLDQKLQLMQFANHSKNSSAALELQMLDELRKGWQERHGLIETDEGHPMWRSMVWEVSAAVNMPTETVKNRIGFARVLMSSFSATFSKMRSGVVTERHAAKLIEYLGGLPDAEAAALEAKLLPFAESMTLGKFERKVRTQVELRDPEKMEERHAAAMEERDSWVDDQKDGMAILSTLMSAIDAHAANNFIHDQAAALKSKGGESETRRIGQIRSDVVRDMILDGEAQVSVTGEGPDDVTEVRDVTRPVRGILPTVAITVPVLSAIILAQTRDENGATKPILPAWLEGYGPIAPSMATRIAGAASGFTRILTDPHHAAPISVGRDKYRPPVEMRDTIIREDGTCRGVGCNRPARECDLDHTVPANEGGKQGRTELSNMAALCPPHHVLKHNGEWTMVQAPDFSRKIYWVSPLGRVYDTYPEYTLEIDSPLDEVLHCMDLGWIIDELDAQTVSNPHSWMVEFDPEVGSNED